MICERQVQSYCYEIEKIENYDLAITDQDRTWDCHHRLEIGANGEVVSREGLIEYGLYYNRPASELIFLTRREHLSLHKRGERHPLFGKHHSEETRKKMSETHKGKPNGMQGKHHSEESCKKMSQSHKGRTFSDEHRRKLSEANKGKHHSEETRKKISEAKKGKKPHSMSEETRRKLSEIVKAYWAKKKAGE